MDEQSLAAPRDLRDAALVRAARKEIDSAIAALAARPLDEAAAIQMRRALGARREGATAALERLSRDASAGSGADVGGPDGAATGVDGPDGARGHGRQRQLRLRHVDGVA